jgi:hypothetical protein
VTSRQLRPAGLPFDRNLLYRNNGDGSFSDVSEESGVAKPFQHYALSLVTGDFNHDGRVDVYVACDQTPSLIHQSGGGKFQRKPYCGAALDERPGAFRHGVTAGDYDGDGTLDLFRSNFSDERETLYRNRGQASLMMLRKRRAGSQHPFCGWGCGFFDFDNDGWNDLLLVNATSIPK